MASVCGSLDDTPSPYEHATSLAKAAALSGTDRKDSARRKASGRNWKALDEAAYSSSDDVLSKLVRPRGFSTSSDHSDVLTNEGGDGDTSNPRKRGSTDAIEYPRRRAIIACEVCRGRKSRCDGAKPRCRLCTELNADCVYREPGVKLDAGDKLILERLNRIEQLLQAGSRHPAISTLSPHVSQAAVASSLPVSSPTMGHGSHAVEKDKKMARDGYGIQHQEPSPIVGLDTWIPPSIEIDISAMPKVDSAPAIDLLQWPIVGGLVSRPYNPQQLLQLEMARQPLQIMPPRSLDMSNVNTYVESFFTRANTWYAVVDPNSWDDQYAITLAQGFRGGTESCMVLLVIALGAASYSGTISTLPHGQAPPGMDFFATAWGLIPQLMIRNTVSDAQCLILAAAYLFYLVRPLEAWSLLSSTNNKLQLLLRRTEAAQPITELGARVYWNALLFETDLRAELDLPHTGIAQLEEVVGLPGGFYASGSQLGSPHGSSVGPDEPWYFLAEISLHRLLNRTSQLLYSPRDHVTLLASLQPVVKELDSQLAQWYTNLPPELHFPHATVPQAHPVQTVLRLRYFACRSIIFRPYIHAVMEDARVISDPSAHAGCLAGLEASLRQLEHVSAHSAGHLPYLWQDALNLVSQCLLVMGATLCPELAALLPPAEETDRIIQGVVAEIDRLGPLSPSLGLGAEVVREAEVRRCVMLRAAGLQH